MCRRDYSLDIMKGVAVVVMVSVHPFVFFVDFDSVWFGDFLWVYDALAVPVFFYCFAFALGMRQRSLHRYLLLGSGLFFSGVVLGLINLLAAGVFSSGVLFTFSLLAFLVPAFDFLLCRLGFFLGGVLASLFLVVFGVVVGGEFSALPFAVFSFVLGYASSRFCLDRFSVFVFALVLSCIGLFMFWTSVYGVTVALMPLFLVLLHLSLQDRGFYFLQTLGRYVLPVYLLHHVLMYVLAYLLNGGRVASYATIFHQSLASPSFVLLVLCFNLSLVFLLVSWVLAANDRRLGLRCG